MDKGNIFISYSRHDEKIVHQIVSMLQKDGFSIWIDKTGIESGDAFKRVIVNAIESAAVVLFFSSESSNSSKWTTKEVGVALYENKPIIPIKLDNSKYNSEIKFDLINLDYVDLTDGNISNFQYNRLVKALKAKCCNEEKKTYLDKDSRNEQFRQYAEWSISDNIDKHRKAGFTLPGKIKPFFLIGFCIIAIAIGLFVYNNINTSGSGQLSTAQSTDIEVVLKDPRFLQERYLTEEDVQGMSSENMRVLRNCIYALHGRTFESPELSKIYNSYSWYHPTVVELDVSDLNKYEKYNIHFLKQRE